MSDKEIKLARILF